MFQALWSLLAQQIIQVTVLQKKIQDIFLKSLQLSKFLQNVKYLQNDTT